MRGVRPKTHARVVRLQALVSPTRVRREPHVPAHKHLVLIPIWPRARVQPCRTFELAGKF